MSIFSEGQRYDDLDTSFDFYHPHLMTVDRDLYAFTESGFICLDNEVYKSEYDINGDILKAML